MVAQTPLENLKRKRDSKTLSDLAVLNEEVMRVDASGLSYDRTAIAMMHIPASDDPEIITEWIARQRRMIFDSFDMSQYMQSYRGGAVPAPVAVELTYDAIRRCLNRD